MSAAPTLPLWAEILVAFFALGGGIISLLGASGLVRLPTFFSRLHAPALITTAGIWCLMLATITYFSVQTGKPALNILLLGLFIAITAPVTTILLMRAALFRARQRGEDVPRSLNALQLATPKMAPEKDDDDEDEGQGKAAEHPASAQPAAAPTATATTSAPAIAAPEDIPPTATAPAAPTGDAAPAPSPNSDSAQP
ncbi:monovalent cation/H(+) antiporter subunit G [Allofranklinella schreckenbergeri]|uniref:monovalent cation/H(+) antiporter subunit G n=1 Tax=Allofranklinella schreckenbergeri TaxID=1076744 RepID=UPI00268B885D|nr:monovalent cation/H(+) antiporter subunit G [Allofranklinella schreckenbergeri]